MSSKTAKLLSQNINLNQQNMTPLWLQFVLGLAWEGASFILMVWQLNGFLTILFNQVWSFKVTSRKICSISIYWRAIVSQSEYESFNSWLKIFTKDLSRSFDIPCHLFSMLSYLQKCVLSQQFIFCKFL